MELGPKKLVVVFQLLGNVMLVSGVKRCTWVKIPHFLRCNIHHKEHKAKPLDDVIGVPIKCGIYWSKTRVWSPKSLILGSRELWTPKKCENPLL